MYWFINLLFIFMQHIYADPECPYIPLNITDNRANNTRLRIVQYNVEWLFSDYYQNSNCPGQGCSWVNQSETNIHIDRVSNVLRELDGDIINLCEIEGCDELNILNSKLGYIYNGYLKKGTDTATGQNVGMLTKIDPIISLYRNDYKQLYPIQNSTCNYTGISGTTGVSKHYITEFKVNTTYFALISAHLLAIPTDILRCAEREAQAIILQQIIYNYTQYGYEIIVIGDFNDYDNRILDLNDNYPISSVLDILKGYNGVFAGTYKLFSVADNIDKINRYSNWWDSDNNCNTSSQIDYSMIDHILVSQNIKKNIDKVYIYHNYSQYCNKYDSDHYPIIIDIIL